MNNLRKINIKNSFSKILLLFLILGVVIVSGCSCKPTPTPDPPFPIEEDDEVYLTVKQGSLTYNIYKNDLYINLKNSYGVGVIADWCDDLVLKSIGKQDMCKAVFGNSSVFDSLDNTTYWDRVDSEAVELELEKNMFPNGREGLTDDEINARTIEFYNNFLVYGYQTREEVLDYYHKKLSAYEVAKDYQENLRKVVDFDNLSYQNNYKNNYFDEFYMILIPFDSGSSYYATLNNLGIEIKVGTKESACWVWRETKTPLTVNEVIEAYIKIYEETNIFKQSVTEACDLVEGVDYNIVDGKYVFDTTNKGQLYYSSSRSKNIPTDVYNLLNSEFSEYSSESTNTNNSWYWASGYEFDGTFYTCLMLSRTPKMPYEEAKPLIKERLLASELNDDFIETILLILRQTYDLRIYEQVLQTGYSNTYGSGTIPEINVDNGDVVVTFKNTLLTKDDLFNLMEKRFGANEAIELVNYYNALYDKEINDVYDLTIEDTSERILNKSKWNYAWETVEAEKNDFEAAVYLKYGYPPSYGWENFLEAIYNVRSSQELAYHYLRENCLYDYLVKKYNINLYGENSLLWKSINDKMIEVAEKKKYSVGSTLNIYILDENNKAALTSDYSEEQITLVKELYAKILDYLLDDVDNYTERINNVLELYSMAGYSFDNASGETSTFDYSKYKSAGIKISFTDLYTFSYYDLEGDMYTAVKILYDANAGTSGVNIYGRDGSDYIYIRDTNSYRIYINTSNPLPRNIEGRTVPTYEECAEYLDSYLNSRDSELTEEQESLVSSIYYQIYMEQIGVYSTALMFYYDQANYEINLKIASYDMNLYRKVLSIFISDCEGQLQYNVK